MKPSPDDLTALATAATRMHAALSAPEPEPPPAPEPEPEPDRMLEGALDDLGRAALKASRLARRLTDVGDPFSPSDAAEELVPIASLFAAVLVASGLPTETLDALDAHVRSARAVLLSARATEAT